MESMVKCTAHNGATLVASLDADTHAHCIQGTVTAQDAMGALGLKIRWVSFHIQQWHIPAPAYQMLLSFDLVVMLDGHSVWALAYLPVCHM